MPGAFHIVTLRPWLVDHNNHLAHVHSICISEASAASLGTTGDFANEGPQYLPDTPTPFGPEHSATLALNSGYQSQAKRGGSTSQPTQPLLPLRGHLCMCPALRLSRLAASIIRYWSIGRPCRSLVHKGSSPLVFIARRLCPLRSPGQISPIGSRKPARSRRPWIPSSLQALVNECRSASTAPRLPVGRDAAHTPHFALWVNFTDRHKERQVPVKYHECEKESQFMFLGALDGTRLGSPIYRRLMDEMMGLASGQAGNDGDDAETAVGFLRARQRNLASRASHLQIGTPRPNHNVGHADHLTSTRL